MDKSLTIDELHEKFEHLKSDELILDIRRPDEYASGHVPGSRNIPHDAVAQHAHELKKYAHVYLYCRSGGRVQIACSALEGLGAKNFSGVLSGGMPDWIAKGYPCEK